MKKPVIKTTLFILLTLLICSLVFPTSTILAHEDSNHEEEMVDIIVRYEDTVPSEESLDPAYKNVRSLDFLPIQTMTVPASAVKGISMQEGVKRVSYDQEMTTLETGARTLSENDWNNDLVNSFDAWDEGYTGKGVSVAIIDTGFYKHSDIQYAGGHSIFEGDEELEADPWYNDHDGHGTHVAGTLAAASQSPARGIAPGVSVYGVKVYHESQGNSTSASNLLEGIGWAINEGVDIINISSGYKHSSPEIHEAIKIAVDSGILVVAASGNMVRENDPVDYPAAHPEVVAVSSVDRTSSIAGNSMISEFNELAAPGQSIYGLSNTAGKYVTLSGTSQAAPHVSGIAAIMMEKFPDLPTSELRNKLQQDAQDLGETGKDPLYGYGLVQYIPTATTNPGTDGTTDSDETTEENNSSGNEQTDSENTEQEKLPVSDDTDTEIEETPESEEPVSIEEPASSETPETDGAPSSPDDQTQSAEVAQNTLWVRPTVKEGSAVIAAEDLAAVADNGVLAVAYDYTMDDIGQLSLTPEQVSIIKDRNISIMIAKMDMEWLIPAGNFQSGAALVRFTTDLSSEPIHQNLAISPLYQFELLTNGGVVNQFEEEMTYRFFTNADEADNDVLYQWNPVSENWIELSHDYLNGAIVGTSNQTGILGVFDSTVFSSSAAPTELDTEPEEAQVALTDETEVEIEETEEALEEHSEEETETEDQEEQKEREAIEDDTEIVSSEQDPVAQEDTEEEIQETAAAQQAEASETSNIPSPITIASVVAILSFGGGFYFFGGKSN